MSEAMLENTLRVQLARGGGIKPAISPKRLKIERNLLLTTYIKKVVHGLSIAAKMYDLE